MNDRNLERIRVLLPLFCLVVFLSSCTIFSGFSKKGGTLSGIVTYEDDIALNPNAIIDIELLDATDTSRPGKLVSLQSFPSAGKQVPLSFELSYDPANIDASHIYVLGARISINGKVVWSSPEAVEVVTKGNPTKGIELVVSLIPSEEGESGLPAEASVSGAVTFQEQFELPQGSLVEIQLLDISQADAPPALLGSQSIITSGEVPPYRFEIPYNPAQIVATNTYIVQAKISSPAGDPLFTNTQIYPVITQGNPTVVELVVESVSSQQQPGEVGSEVPGSAPSITIEAPQPFQALQEGVHIVGKTNQTSPGNDLGYFIFDLQGNKLGGGYISVTGEPEQPGIFDAELELDETYSGPAQIILVDRDVAAGSIRAYTAVDIYLGMPVPPEARPLPELLETRRIFVDSPGQGATVTNPFEIKGSVTVAPFENFLLVRLYNANGEKIGDSSIQVQAPVGGPGVFTGSISYPQEVTGPGWLEVLEVSAADGSVLTRAWLNVAFE